MKKNGKYPWKFAGGILLAAAAHAPLSADEVPVPGLPLPAVEPLPAPRAGGSPAMLAPAPRIGTAPSSQYVAVPDCPPRQPGPLARWHARRKARCQANLWGYPEEFIDAPLGAMVDAQISTSVARGQEARMVLMQYDFVAGSTQLKPRGRAQLARIAGWLPMNGFPVCIEPSLRSPELDEGRRQTVWHELSAGLCPVPLERVVIGMPGGYGLEGQDAMAIDRSRLQQTGNRGASAGGSAGAAGGAAGGAGSMGSSGSGSGSSSAATAR